MIKHNNDIRTKARENGVYLYEIAEKLNISEPTFNRWLRKELSEDLKQKALAAIELIREEHEAEQGGGESPLQSWKKNFLFSSAVIQAFAIILNELFQRVANYNDDCGSDEGFQGSFPLTQAVLLTKQVMRYTYSAAAFKCARNNLTDFRRKDENHYD